MKDSSDTIWGFTYTTPKFSDEKKRKVTASSQLFPSSHSVFIRADVQRKKGTFCVPSILYPKLRNKTLNMCKRNVVDPKGQ
jgi:hypothetical protein